MSSLSQEMTTDHSAPFAFSSGLSRSSSITVSIPTRHDVPNAEARSKTGATVSIDRRRAMPPACGNARPATGRGHPGISIGANRLDLDDVSLKSVTYSQKRPYLRRTCSIHYRPIMGSNGFIFISIDVCSMTFRFNTRMGNGDRQ